jgi:hypothetical protein
MFDHDGLIRGLYADLERIMRMYRAGTQLACTAREVTDMAKGNKKGGTSGSQQTGKKKRKQS